MAARWPDPLPCGHGLDELISQVADGVDGDLEHQEHCAHCRQALDALRELWVQVDELARERVDAPPSIEHAVLRRVRRDLFVARAIEAFGGILPRLSRALFTYAGLMREDPS